jgi:hypothetical protein
MSEQLNIEDFSKHLNTKFKVYRTDDEIFEAELVGVYDLRNDHVLQTFSVEFLLPREFGVEQKIYKIEHPELGTIELFMVPVEQNESGIRFEAIFNRLMRK